MSDLKRLERQIFKTNFQDGIYELEFGPLFLVMALNPSLSSTGMPKFLSYRRILLAGLILYLGKRQISIPRQGLVRFNKARKALSLGRSEAETGPNSLCVRNIWSRLSGSLL